VMASSSHLKAGEKGAITARVATQAKQGAVIETVEVLTNDPRRPKVSLTLRATVLETLTVPLQQSPVR